MLLFPLDQAYAMESALHQELGRICDSNSLADFFVPDAMSEQRRELLRMKIETMREAKERMMQTKW